MAKFPTYEQMAKDIAEKALDEILYDGKSIREWMQIIASEDCISRQAVLDKIKEVCFSREQEWVDFRVSQGSYGQRDLIISFIEDLPSVQPKLKTGHWIDRFPAKECKCSVCDFLICISDGSYLDMVGQMKYCPNCGAKMAESEGE